jgi:hypothetical protein
MIEALRALATFIHVTRLTREMAHCGIEARLTATLSIVIT